MSNEKNGEKVLKADELWFEKNVFENKEELLEIGQLALKTIEEKFNLGMSRVEMVLGWYYATFTTICSNVRKQQSGYDNFSVNIANLLEVGFTNSEEDDVENPGNFSAYIRHIENKKVMNSMVDEDEEEAGRSVVLATQWNAANITTQTEFIKIIATEAVGEISKLINLGIGSWELIIPIFCTIHYQIVEYLKLKKVELGVADYEINVLGLYDAGIQDTSEETEIYFRTTVGLRRYFKDDERTTGQYE